MHTVVDRPPASGERSWDLWTTTARVVVQSPDPRALDAAVDAVRRVTSAVDRACSRFRPDSELMARAADLERGCAVSPLLADLMRTALGAAEATDGDVDPTLGAELISLGCDLDRRGAASRPVAHGDGRRAASGRPRGSAERTPRWRDVELRGTRLRIPAGVVVDLGATAKAWTADRAAELAAAASGAAVLVSLGGDIATAGDGPAEGWQVLVQDTDEDPAQVVSLRSGWAVATSSTRRRRWEHDGTPVHHILDPRWGVPAAPLWRSVTVASATCVGANTWSTAAVVRGSRAVRDLSSRRLAARLVAADRTVIRTPLWPEDRGDARMP